MTEKTNPFEGFSDESHGEARGGESQENQNMQDSSTNVNSDTNPFEGFELETDEERKNASLGQAVVLGAVAGAYKGQKNAAETRKNIEIAKQKGSQGYLSGALPPDMKLTLNNLQLLTGMPVRTQSEIQAAIAQLQARPATREPRIRELPLGRRTTTSYVNTPAKEFVDLSQFNIEPEFKAKLKGGAGGMLSGALAAPAIYQAMTQKEPTDWTQKMAISGALPSFFPNIASKVPGLNYVAPFLGVPYAIKHKDELLNQMSMFDFNPTAFPAGTIGSEESPMQEPSRSTPLQSQTVRANEEQRRKLGYGQQQTPPQPQLSYPEKLREEGRRAFPNKSATLLDYLMLPAYSGAVAGRRD